MAAKHEVIHILIGEVSELHYQAFCSQKEVTRATESLVRKLENIIN